MKTFQWIDIGVQIGIMLLSAILLFINPIWAIFLYFPGLLAWNLTSMAVHFFRPLPPSEARRRRWLPYPVLVLIMLAPFTGGALLAYPVFQFAYFGSAFVLSLYYLWISYRELVYLHDLRDQVSLINI